MKYSIQISALISVVEALLLAPANFQHANAFVVPNNGLSRRAAMVATLGGVERKRSSFALWYADPIDTWLDIDTSEIRDELKSYGISTTEEATDETDDDILSTVNDAKNNDNSIREKLSSKWKDVASAAKEMVEKYVVSAVREMEEKDVSDNSLNDLSAEDDFPPENEEFVSTRPSTENTSYTDPSSVSRQERYDNALEGGRSMSISSLRQELKNRGISTVTFFEKSDLLKAYANAIADDIKMKDSEGPNTVGRNQRDNYDPSYRDVVVRAFNPRTLLGGDVIIDIA